MACCDRRDIPQSRHFLSFPAIFHLLEAGVSKLLAASEACTAKSAMSDMKIGLCSMDGPGGPLPRANHPPGVADTTPDLKGQGLRREERVQLGSLSVDFLCRNKGPQSHPASSSIIQHHPALEHRLDGPWMANLLCGTPTVLRRSHSRKAPLSPGGDFDLAETTSWGLREGYRKCSGKLWQHSIYFHIPRFHLEVPS